MSSASHPADAFVVRTLARYASVLDMERGWRQRRETFRADWPSWCELPMAAANAMVQSLPRNSAPAVIEMSALTAALSWRRYKVIYRFAPTLRQALTDCDALADIAIPCDVFYRLPYPIVYVDDKTERSVGFFAWLDKDHRYDQPDLRFLFLTKDGMCLPFNLQLLGGTIAECVEKQCSAEDYTGGGADIWAEILKDSLTDPLSMLLYLCSANADVPDLSAAEMIRTLQRTRQGAVKRSMSIDVGLRVGAALRSSSYSRSASGGGTHSSPVPHMRRAHWHHFWTGPRDGDRTLVLKWLAPTPVNADTDAVTATVIPIKSLGEDKK